MLTATSSVAVVWLVWESGSATITWEPASWDSSKVITCSVVATCSWVCITYGYYKAGLEQLQAIHQSGSQA